MTKKHFGGYKSRIFLGKGEIGESENLSEIGGNLKQRGNASLPQRDGRLWSTVARKARWLERSRRTQSSAVGAHEVIGNHKVSYHQIPKMIPILLVCRYGIIQGWISIRG